VRYHSSVFELREYCDDRGKPLYSEWLDTLDVKTRARIDFFGRHGGEMIILLIGGEKRSQSRDIKQAQALWRRVQEEKLWHHSKVITKG
jgi:putative component of toxin-antitoxin plasmid stabilization module